VWVRYIGNDGQPGFGPVRVDSGSNSGFHSCDIAVNRLGETLAVWSTGGLSGSVLARRLQTGGLPQGDVLTVAQMGNRATAGARVGAAPDGGFLVVWGDGNLGDYLTIQARRLHADGSFGAAFPVSELVGPFEDTPYTGSRPLFRPDGSFSVVWLLIPRVFPPNFTTPVVLGRSFNAAGQPTGHQATLRASDDYQAPAAALDPAGNVFLVTNDFEEGLRGRLYDPTWNPVSAEVTISTTIERAEKSPVVAANAAGTFLALWHVGSPVLFPFPAIDGDFQVLGQLVGAGCPPSTGALCLGPGGRFEVRASWKNPFTGETGTGHPVPLTGDTGALWFFDDQNLELLVKVLDGRALNGHFWVFAGALSNVEYTLTVTDTQTGAQRSYHNPALQFSSRADVRAFPDDSPLSLQAVAASTATVPPVAAPEPLTPPLPLCSPSPVNLCFEQNFFEVTVEFTDPRTGVKGTARSVPITEDTGAFWFFDPSNLELMVKVLDGTSINGHYWIFFGGLSDVDYTVTLTEHGFGSQRVYRNRRGELASRADVEAY
jgi:hypothetical protein